MCFQGTKDFALVEQCGVHCSAFKHRLRKKGLLLKQALSFPSVSWQGALVPTSTRSDVREPCAFGRTPVSVECWDLAKTEASRPEYIVPSIYFEYIFWLLGLKLKCWVPPGCFREAVPSFAFSVRGGECDIPQKGHPRAAECRVFHSHFLHVY